MASYHRCLRGRCATTRSAPVPDIGHLKYQLCVFAPLAFFVLLSGLIGQFWEGWRKPSPSWTGSATSLLPLTPCRSAIRLIVSLIASAWRRLRASAIAL